MKLEVLLRAAQILRSQPAYTMTLARLHNQLVRELGAAASTYAQTYHDLKLRPQSFTLLDAPTLLGDLGCWPDQLRQQYDRALDSAGLGACIRVMLTEHETEPDDALLMAGATLAELSNGADAVMREYLVRAAEDLEEISAATEFRTTHPPDPRSEP